MAAVAAPTTQGLPASQWPDAEHSGSVEDVSQAYDVDQDGDLPDPICGGCKKLIDEASADAGIIQFSTQLWHVDCFRCAKCDNPVSTEREDILLLSDGHPICGQCNYSCQVCNLPIMEEAIITGDESYHAACFTCRSCNSRIEELVFAKTSQGIYCMSCHNERVARSRRHAEKRNRAAKQREGQLARQKARDAEAAANAAARGSSDQQLADQVERQRFNSADSNAQSGEGDSAEMHESLLPATHVNGVPPSPSHSTFSAKGGSIAHGESQSNAVSPMSSRRPSSATNNGLPPRDASAFSARDTSNLTQNTTPSLRELRSGTGPNYNSVTERPGSTASSRNGSMSQATGQAEATAITAAQSHQNGDERAEPSSNVSSVSRNGGPQSSRIVPTVVLPSSDSTEGSEEVTEPANTLKSRASDLSDDRRFEEEPSPMQVKRASRVSASDMQEVMAALAKDDAASANATLSSKRLSASTPASLQVKDSLSVERSSKTYSFYDPDFLNLMDSFSHFDTKDDFKLSSPHASPDGLSASPTSKRDRRTSVAPGVPPMPSPPDARSLHSDGALSPSGSNSHTNGSTTGDSLRSTNTSSLSVGTKDATHASQRGHDDTLETMYEGDEPASSRASLNTITAKMRESMKTAKGGHVSMDTGFVESILRDLESTKEAMKSLQSKYDRIKRASQQAAQGFSMAREEFEAEVQARHEAEVEIASLKRKLLEQSSQLTKSASLRAKEEQHERKTHEIQSNLQGMERDLAKLTIERDLTVAEVSELAAMRSGNTAQSTLAPLSEGATSNLSRNLSVRLDTVKEKYRAEINELVAERDALLIEIEELRQSKEVFLEETQSLNARNEELNAIVAQLTRRVDLANRSATGGSAARSPMPLPPTPSKGGNANTSGSGSGTGFGFGFGKQSRNGGLASADSNQGSGMYSSDPPDVGPAAFQRAKPEKLESISVAKKFKWGKSKLADSARGIAQSLPINSPPVPPKMGASGGNDNSAQQGQQLQAHNQMRGNSNEIIVREHLFSSFNVLRPIRCFACQKNMWGQSEVRCSLCGQACHSRCLQNLPTSCNQPFSRPDENIEALGPSMFGKDLVEQCEFEQRDVPIVVVKCVQAVETLGMDYEGIYRKSGGTSQLRVITQLFERGQPFNLEDTDRFNDVSAITSVLKNYFRELPTPLLTFDLHERFIQASEIKSDAEAKAQHMRTLVNQLPREHFDTLRCLVEHLHRVQLRSEENRMNSRNLGVVFGPTLMRSADPSKEFSHMGGKAMTIEYFIDNPQVFDE